MEIDKKTPFCQFLPLTRIISVSIPAVVYIHINRHLHLHTSIIINSSSYKMSLRSENLESRRNPQGRETEDLDRKSAHQDIENEVSKEEENQNQIVVGGIGKDEGFNIVGDYRKNLPPIDDVCPICFDRFTIPCRTNCGHWYCASCILEFWAFRSSIRPCKCPLCCCQITNLVPVISRLIGHEEDVIVVAQKVRQYNSLYIGGVRGFFLKIRASPLVIRRILRIMMDPYHFRFIYYIMRFLGVLLPFLYEMGEFEFIPTGGLGIHRMLDVSTNVLVLTFLIISIWRKWAARGRAWRSAIIQAWRA